VTCFGSIESSSGQIQDKVLVHSASVNYKHIKVCFFSCSICMCVCMCQFCAPPRLIHTTTFGHPVSTLDATHFTSMANICRLRCPACNAHAAYSLRAGRSRTCLLKRPVVSQTVTEIRIAGAPHKHSLNVPILCLVFGLTLAECTNTVSCIWPYTR